MKLHPSVMLLSVLYFFVMAPPIATGAVNGPIRVSKSGRGFVDKSGQPFLWLGDTAWPLFAQYTREQAEAYLESRSKKGYSVVQGVLVWGKGSGLEDEKPLANIHGDAPWLDNDPRKPNPAYFRHVDQLVEFANQHDLIVSLMVAWGYYVVDAKTVNLTNARAYGRWLGEHFKNTPNVVFANGGDRVPLYFEEVYREIGRGLREGDGGAHLITFHPSGWRSSSEFFHQEDWLDFNSIQTWTDWAHVHDAVITDGWMTPPKPTVVAEGAYEDGPEYPRGPITPLIVRRQAWYAYTSGGFFTNGHTQNWQMQPGWEKMMESPGAVQVGRIREILRDLPWWDMIPDDGLIMSGGNAGPVVNTAFRAKAGDRALVYLASQCHVFLNLEKFQVRRVAATWINPATGATRPAGTYVTGNDNGKVWPERSVVHFFVPDSWEDALLRFDPVPDEDPTKDGVRK